METTILIVDDSPYIVDGLVALLKRKGFSTVTASGGEQALASLRTITPDLILLDIMMEPMDGWETLERIKAAPGGCDVPVLMFSAKKISAEEAGEHSLSIDDFVSKPVNPAQLLEAIGRVFARRAAVREETTRAKGMGVETGLIEEYSRLRKSIEVDTNLLQVLKKTRGTHFPGREADPEDILAIQKLEEKIAADEKRLAAISGDFCRPA